MVQRGGTQMRHLGTRRKRNRLTMLHKSHNGFPDLVILFICSDRSVGSPMQRSNKSIVRCSFTLRDDIPITSCSFLCSFCTVLRHNCLCLLFLLLPRGSRGNSRDFWVVLFVGFLKVWSIYLAFPSPDIVFDPLVIRRLSQRSSFDIVLGHQTPRMYRGLPLRAWILVMILLVSLQVSDP